MHRRVECVPGMLVVVAADHLAVVGPAGKRDRRAVDSDEPFPVVVDRGHEVGTLLVVHLEGAAGVEDDGVEVVQVLRVVFQLLLRQCFGVGADDRVPEAGVTSELVDGHHRVGDRLVPVPFFLADDEELLLRRRRLCRDGETHDRDCRYRPCETNSLHPELSCAIIFVHSGRIAADQGLQEFRRPGGRKRLQIRLKRCGGVMPLWIAPPGLCDIIDVSRPRPGQHRVASVGLRALSSVG